MSLSIHFEHFISQVQINRYNEAQKKPAGNKPAGFLISNLLSLEHVAWIKIFVITLNI